MPVATIAEARDEILTHFTTAWDAQTPPVPTLLYAHLRQAPPDSGNWARVSVRHAAGEQRTIGAPGGRRFEHAGIVNVEIYVEAGVDGFTTGDALVEVARNAFEGQSTAPDAVEFRNVRVSEQGADGRWDRVDVTADFEYDIVK